MRTGLERCLARLWRYALVLSGANAAAQELVVATCALAVERSDQYIPGSRLDRWLFAILRSIWLNELALPGSDDVDTQYALVFRGAHDMDIPAADGLRAISRLPREMRETVLLVYSEGYSYAEAAEALETSVDLVRRRLAEARLAMTKVMKE